MSALAHHRVEIAVDGEIDTILSEPALHCDDGTIGERTVRKWAQEEAVRLGVRLKIHSLHYRAAFGWEGHAIAEALP